MRKMLRSVLVFLFAGLLGPAIRFATWPPSTFDTKVSKSFSDFVYHLVLLLWPVQPLAVVEVNVGRLAAAALAVGANLVVFAFLGGAIGTFARSRGPLVTAYLLVCVLLFLWALWGNGYSFAHLSVPALATALLLYAIPFWVVLRGLAGTD